MVVGIVFFFYLNTRSSDTYAAGSDYTSVQSGLWTESSTWNTGTFPGTITGGSTVAIPAAQDILIERYVTSHYHLDFAKEAILTITDTLVILGNLTLDKEASLVVGPSGVLVVQGDLVSAKELSVASGGVIAVGGDATFAKDLSYDDSSGGELFVVGSVSEKNTSQLGSAQDGTALESAYPDIYGVITGTVSALPITLLDFTVRLRQQQVLIEWTTESETNNDYFEIERSVDGQQYEVVGTVPGAGTSTSVRTYRLIDEQPLTGVSYYRLRQTDFDGQQEAFDWVAVSFDGMPNQSATLSLDNIFPNPFNTSCSVAFTPRGTSDVVVQLMNMQGTVIASKVASAHTTQVTFDNLAQLRPGTYLVRLVQDDMVTPTQRVLKR